MRRHTSAMSLMKAQTAMFERLKLSRAQAYDAMTRLVLKDQKRLLAGSTSQAQFNRENNPFGIGNVNPRGKMRSARPGLPIHRQTYRLYNSMRLVSRDSQGRFSRTGVREIIAPTPYTRFILAEAGTSRMRARGFRQEARKLAKARQAALVRQYPGIQRSAAA